MAEASAEELLREMVDFLHLEAEGDSWRARTPAWFGDTLFGGFVLAQAAAAAQQEAPGGRRLHSMHAYFLRPVRGGGHVNFTTEILRAGRTFAIHAVNGYQDGKHAIATMCSFTADTDGYVYDLGRLNGVPPRDDAAIETGPGPWEAVYLGPTEPLEDGTRTSTHRMWFRIPVEMPHDPRLHAAFLAFATDWTGIGGRPLHLEGDTSGMISLDHAIWFHREARVDQWLFYDVQSLVNNGGRGLLRGVIRDPEGLVVASVAQEMLLRPV